LIRSIRPTDLVAFARFNDHALPNEARTYDRTLRDVSGRLSPIPFVREWLSLEEQRHTWIRLDNGKIVGVVSSRSSGCPRVWEVDRLRFAHTLDAPAVCTDLLDYLAAVGAENQVHRLFLRLDADSDLTPAARRAGFVQYAMETACALPAGPTPRPALPSGFTLRPRQPVDTQPLFRFYSQVVPADVRRAVAMTVSEWEDVFPSSTGRRHREMVLAEGDEIIGWSRAVRTRAAVICDVVCEPSDARAPTILVQEAMSWARRLPYLVIPVPEYHDRLASAIGDLGGRPIAHYAACTRHLAVRVKAPLFVPVGA
jgi:hypothetical protein